MRRLLTILLLCGACAGAEVSGARATTSTPATPATSAPSTSTPTTSAAAPSTTATHRNPVYIDERGFNDHTVPQLTEVADYHALSKVNAAGQEVVKFTIDDFSGTRGMHWMDANFFTLHDEWYWFRLLNGQPVPGADEAPAQGLQFDSIEEIYAWAERTPASDYPIELATQYSQAVGGTRLFSPLFYPLVLDSDPRQLAAGSLVHLPATDTMDAHWIFEIEYSDEPTVEELEIIFARLVQTLPPVISDDLRWVIRSPFHDELAQRLVATGHALADRTVRYRDVVEAGQVAVYNPGIAAGRLLVIGEGGKDLSEALPTDIVLVENIPDELPPASALISSSPQTPLAHVNLLARNRGIPNVSLSGVLDNDAIRQAARVRAPAIVRATADGNLEIALMTTEAYNEWQQARVVSATSVPTAASAGTAVIDLEPIASTIASEDDLARWRPLLGGKATGFLTLLATNSVPLPRQPVAITVEPYLSHIAQFDHVLDAMLANRDFARSQAIRFLLLEGSLDFAETYVATPDIDDALAFAADHPAGTVLGDVLAAGGFKAMVRAAPLDPGELEEIEGALAVAYADHPLAQGLRFRSSSSVEDVEGFSGAGLYDSNTGFRSTDVAPQGDQHKTVEWAIKKTWASYWSFEAFEERRIEHIDHRSGAMGVLVHARFDDELEQNNGVATITMLPDGGNDAIVASINVQTGSLSVANPEGGELPEVIEIRQNPDGQQSIMRRSGSSVTDEAVLSDDDAFALFSAMSLIAERWRDQTNAALPVSQHVTVVALDLEFKTMRSGWAGRPEGGLVIKQARSLEPGLRHVPTELQGLPVPLDVLARASRIERTGCVDGQTIYQVFTDPLSVPDLGFAVEPFIARIDGTGVFDAACRPATVLVTDDEFLIDLLDADDALSILNAD